MEYFKTSTANLLTAEGVAGVAHHVALSVVGAEHMPDRIYMRAKVAQERMIEAGNVPYTIVRATQFFEFLSWIANLGGERDTLCLSTALMQPLATDDVAIALARIALAAPVIGIVVVAGPETLPIADFVSRFPSSSGDKRSVVGDPEARYAGASLATRGLNPGANARIGGTRFEDWAAQTGFQGYAKRRYGK